MCQPGGPAPHGLGHDGSPGLARLPQREVERVLLVLVDLDRARRPACRRARWRDSLPYAGEARDAEVDVAVATR